MRRLSYANFGNPLNVNSERVREAVNILSQRFEYDGKMAANVALAPEMLRSSPLCRLIDLANILIMPGFYSAHIARKRLQKLGGGTIIGPVLSGMTKAVQIASLNSPP